MSLSESGQFPQMYFPAIFTMPTTAFAVHKVRVPCSTTSAARASWLGDLSFKRSQMKRMPRLRLHAASKIDASTHFWGTYALPRVRSMQEHKSAGCHRYPRCEDGARFANTND